MTLIKDLLNPDEPSFSFEFFPPQTDLGEENLFRAVAELESLNPTFVSVTYGAGGSTRDRTLRIVQRIAEQTSMLPMAHLTCVSATVPEVQRVIDDLAAAGIRNILALRGDMPGGTSQAWQATVGGLTHAHELVSLIRDFGEFCVGVASFPEGHPESPDRDGDARHLAAKLKAGADFAITQLFFNAEDYFSHVEMVRAHGSTAPIIPGVMPVTNLGQITRFAELSGAAFPDWLAQRLLAVQDDPYKVRSIGVEVATELCLELLAGGAPGIHFYTLNRSTATREVWANLHLGHA
ncbi:MAG: methylenetetrahydrofolate reductase [NAD(P)H] [Euzebya sp.]